MTRPTRTRQRAGPSQTSFVGVIGLLAALLLLPLAFAPRAEAFIYWAGPWRDGSSWIGRADLDGSGLNPDFISLPSPDAGYPRVAAIAVDDTHIYWAGSRSKTQDAIGRAKLDGTKVNKHLISGIPPLAGGRIAVTGDHIYWANRSDDVIGRANLDGTGVEPDFISATGGQSGSTLGHGVAVDGNHVYWTTTTYSLGGMSDTIGRANLDGTSVDLAFISGMPLLAGGIAVDGEHIYWTQSQGDPPTGAIGRANLDGSEVEGFIGFSLSTGEYQPYEVAVDDKNVYWSAHNWRGGDTIGRANLDGTSVDLDFIPGVGRSLAVDGLTDTRIAGKSSAARTQRQRGKKVVVRVKVKAKERLSAKVRGKIKINPTYRLKPQKVDLARDDAKKLKLKPKKAKAKQIVAALKHGEKAKAKVTVSLTDLAGNSETERLRVRLKR